MTNQGEGGGGQAGCGEGGAGVGDGWQEEDCGYMGEGFPGGGGVDPPPCQHKLLGALSDGSAEA